MLQEADRHSSPVDGSQVWLVKDQIVMPQKHVAKVEISSQSDGRFVM